MKKIGLIAGIIMMSSTAFAQDLPWLQNSAPAQPPSPTNKPAQPASSIPRQDNTLLTLSYADAEDTELSEGHKKGIDIVLNYLKESVNNRVEILSYAANAGSSAHAARRASLKRGLAVREYLIGNAIARERIVIKALGDAHEGYQGNYVLINSL